MIVLDTSAAVSLVLEEPPIASLVERIASDPDLHAPHLIDVEVVHSLRRLVRLGEITLDRALVARLDFVDLEIVRYSHVDLLDRMWELRDNSSAYDAAFIALAETLDAPIVTRDGRLARSPGHSVIVEAY